MSDKTEKKVGALHSELRIELHTQYAINTWSGRPASDGKPSLIGMPLFFRFISRINRDSLADNPWADAALVEVETLLETASQQLQKWLNDIDALMAMLPANASVSGVTSKAPLNIGVHSHTPLGYRCVYLLVGFDQLILRVFRAHHYGLMSLKERKPGYIVVAIKFVVSSLSLCVTVLIPLPARILPQITTLPDRLSNNLGNWTGRSCWEPAVPAFLRQ